MLTTIIYGTFALVGHAYYWGSIWKHREECDVSHKMKNSTWTVAGHVFTLEKDTSNYMWENYLKILIDGHLYRYLLLYGVTVVLIDNRQIQKWTSTILCISWTLSMFGWWRIAALLAVVCLSYATVYTKSVLPVWAINVVSSVSLVYHTQNMETNLSEFATLAFYASTCWVATRCISFCADILSEENKASTKTTKKKIAHNFRIDTPNFVNFIHYSFYLPAFFCGPTVRYKTFSKTYLETTTVIQRGWRFILALLMLFVGHMVTDLILHLMPFNAMSQSMPCMSKASVPAIVGLTFSMCMLFYMTFYCIYSIGILFMILDGKDPPALPKCVMTTYTFRDIWRYFDVGLYEWLKWYIYIPLGGSRHGVLRRIRSVVAVCAFVILWHGMEWQWGVLNCAGILCEVINLKITPQYIKDNKIFSIIGQGSNCLAVLFVNLLYLVHPQIWKKIVYTFLIQGFPFDHGLWFLVFILTAKFTERIC